MNGPESEAGLRWLGRTIGWLVEEHASRFSDRDAIVSGGRTITYADLGQDVRLLANGLREFGVGHGDRVGVWLPNSPEWVCSFLAASSIGAVTVGINTRYRKSEVEFVLKHSGASTIIMGSHLRKLDCLELLGTICPELTGSQPGDLHSTRLPDLRTVIAVDLTDRPELVHFKELVDASRRGSQGTEGTGQPSSTDPAVIQYTSGTTESPKGALLSHGAMLQNGYSFGNRMGLDETDRYFNAAPYFHAGGLIGTVLNALTHGACVVQVSEFEPATALRILQDEECTGHGGVDTVYLKEMQHPNFDDFDLTRLTKGSVAASGPVVSQISDTMGIPGIITAYGLSEATCNVTTTSVEDSLSRKAKSVGRPHEGVEVRIVDADTATTVPTGVVGEVQVRGWTVMLGYFADPAATHAAIDPDGWLRTGDLGMLDDNGYLSLAGRGKDVIRVGGENLAPYEVEHLLNADVRIRQAQVVGAPDPILGEVPWVFVEPSPNGGVTEADVVALCQDRLAGYKVPRKVIFVEDWPLTANGKVRKGQLRERAALEAGRMKH